MVVGAGVAARAGALIGIVVASEAPHDCTPPWPRRAPDRFAPVKDVPPLRVAVTVPAVCAWETPVDSNNPVNRATEKRRCCIQKHSLSAVQRESDSPLGRPDAPRFGRAYSPSAHLLL